MSTLTNWLAKQWLISDPEADDSQIIAELQASISEMLAAEPARA
jgi:hypothetical protein